MRKAITKKTRFEVFKRDSFTCQYCGKSAPTVILHADHIDPVISGGDNSILNLITSCSGCNLGKGGRKLSDQSALIKQIDIAKQQKERLEQIELMSKWKMSLLKVDEEGANAVEKYLASFVGRVFTDSFRANIRSCIKKYGLQTVYDASDKSVSQYFIKNNSQDVEKTFSMIPKICYWIDQEKKYPSVADKAAICAIAQKRWYNCNRPSLWRNLIDLEKEGFTKEQLINAVACSTGIISFEKYIEELRNE